MTENQFIQGLYSTFNLIYGLKLDFTFQPGPEPWQQCQESHSPCTSYRLFLCIEWLLASSFAPDKRKIKQDDGVQLCPEHLPTSCSNYGETHLHHHTCLFDSPVNVRNTISNTRKWNIFIGQCMYCVGNLLGSMKQPVSLVKENSKTSQMSWQSNLDRSHDRIRLVFCVIFSFFQVSVLGLFVLLRILEAHSWKEA